MTNRNKGSFGVKLDNLSPESDFTSCYHLSNVCLSSGTKRNAICAAKNIKNVKNLKRKYYETFLTLDAIRKYYFQNSTDFFRIFAHPDWGEDTNFCTNSS